MIHTGMKRCVFAMILAAAFVLPSGAATYQIDAAHSDVLFKVKHLGISTVTGRFEKFSGHFDFAPGDLKNATVTAVVEVTSVDTNQPKRDDHLRSADFFDAAAHPQMTFVSKEIIPGGDGGFRMAGDLTIRGNTRPVVFDVETGGEIVDSNGKKRVAFTATAKINRKDYGLAWSAALETGQLVVAEQVQIILDVTGVESDPEAAKSSS